MSSDGLGPVAITVKGLSKEYQVFGRPHERILQAVARRRGSARVYGFTVQAVSGLSFDVRQGEALAIIGRNGSGKSTLLEMITGTLEPTAGAVDVIGRISALLELGAGFNPDFTGRQNYRLNASILGLSPGEIREMEPVVEAFADIGPFIDEPVRTYSSGMYVRLAFATAVHSRPEILIVDEALAVGDIFFQQKCYEFIENELEGVTKLLVTHDLAAAVKLADRCIVLDRGRLMFDGDPLEAVQTYTALHLSERAPQGVPDSFEAVPEAAESDTQEQLQSVPADASSSPSVFTIERIGGRRIGPDGRAVELNGAVWPTVPGDRIELHARVRLGVDVAEPVIGYLMRDRVGNALFGQNSVGSEIELVPLRAGRYQLELAFVWPEVDAGEYTITIGLGDGRHPHYHRILAWVQGAAAFSSVPSRPVHGMWNNDLTAVRLTGLSR